MKANRSLILSYLFLATLILSSCADKDDDNTNKGNGAKNTENQSINDWMYKEMSFRYFWNERMPAQSNIDFNLAPDDFFYKTLYRYKKADGDRFSYLENDGVPHFANVAVDNKAKHDIGFEFQAYLDRANKITLCVTYIKNGSRAEKQGLKRGDWINKVDNTPLHEGNFGSILFTGKPSYKLQFENREDLTIETSSNYAENPIHKKDIIKLQDGKKVGYIVYNFFANDADDKTMSYALQMNSIMREFESAKIDDLILDLRYNGGGYVESGNYIASAIVPNRGATGTTIYTKRAFNKKYDESIKGKSGYEQQVNEFFHDYISKGRVQEEIPRLDMKRLYVITSKYTASASEQIINGLRAYITDVEVIGETTTGKNMESYDIKDYVNKENKWVLHALTSVSYNSKANKPEDNNYSQGFPPTIGNETSEIHFFQDNSGNLKPYPIYELGDPQERLLAIALNNISGAKQRVKRSIGMPSESGVSIGSSLERKRNYMIITDQEEKQ